MLEENRKDKAKLDKARSRKSTQDIWRRPVCVCVCVCVGVCGWMGYCVYQSRQAFDPGIKMATAITIAIMLFFEWLTCDMFTSSMLYMQHQF